MKIYLDIYQQLLSCPAVPPETGGILGGKHGVVDQILFDQAKSIHDSGKYIPNVQYLNKMIDIWQIDGIEFYGMFHSHKMDWSTLSGDDKKYIRHIMESMPDVIHTLYFPLVFSGIGVKGFRAVRGVSGVYIMQDDINIIEKGV